MLTVTKEFVWDSAHMLYGHKGLCKNVHGHTYKMQVEVARTDSEDDVISNGASEGMVIDFKALKEIVKGELVDKLDHAYITSGDSSATEEYQITELLTSLGMKIYDLGERPTAENMAREFARFINRRLNEAYYGIRLVSVTVWETPTSFSKYII